MYMYKTFNLGNNIMCSTNCKYTTDATPYTYTLEIGLFQV